jgi:hypothetical protein
MRAVYTFIGHSARFIVRRQICGGLQRNPKSGFLQLLVVLMARRNYRRARVAARRKNGPRKSSVPTENRSRGRDPSAPIRYNALAKFLSARY